MPAGRRARLGATADSHQGLLRAGDILALPHGSTMIEEVGIPKRAVFKSTEVCTIAGVQQYILRSWEAEFPSLARARTEGGARVYRRADVEMVLQIKALVYGEGLTLGAAHRKLDEGKEAAPSGDEDTLLVGLFDSDARDRIVEVKQGLRAILERLSPNGQTASSPVANPAQEVETQVTSDRRPEGEKTRAKKRFKTARTARPAKTSTAVKATKTAKPKKVAKRKQSA